MSENRIPGQLEAVFLRTEERTRQHRYVGGVVSPSRASTPRHFYGGGDIYSANTFNAVAAGGPITYAPQELATAIEFAVERAVERAMTNAVRSLEQTVREGFERLEASLIATGGNASEPLELSITEIDDRVQQFFASQTGAAFDADQVAEELGIPISAVIDSMDRLEANGAIRPSV